MEAQDALQEFQDSDLSDDEVAYQILSNLADYHVGDISLFDGWLHVQAAGLVEFGVDEAAVWDAYHQVCEEIFG